MSDNDSSLGEPTRRDYVKYGGAVLGSGLVAGCISGGDNAAEEATSETTDTPDSYTVSMEPVGEVTFEETPEQWVAYNGSYADMAVAIGQADGLTGMGAADRYFTNYYDELPGVEVDESVLESYPEVRTKEQFYELDADVHLYDPGMLRNWFDWSQEDIDEIASNVAPFFGNLIFRRSENWHDYRYYTLYEAFEKVAAVFQEEDRFEAWQSLHDEFIADLQSRLPPEDERPEMALLGTAPEPPTEFSPYHLDQGTQKKQWHDIGVKDAFEGTGIEPWGAAETKVDYETLLEVDPEMIVIGHVEKTREEFEERIISYMEDDPVASELTAVQNGRVYRGGLLYQGPIHNLFMTERAAKQAYPNEFGDIKSDTELFDRQRVADIVNGDF